MIAELPTRSVPAAEENLFAGMSIASFPTAPTSAIVLNRNPDVSVVTENRSTPAQSSSTSTEKYDQALAEEFETTSLLPAQEKTSTKKPVGSLASLYATEVITPEVVSAYPELPNIVHRGQISPQRENTAQRTYEDEHPTEYASLLGNNSNVAATASTGTSEADASVISEILRENNRLTEELERMRRLMGQQGAAAQPQTRAAVATPPPALHTSVENPATGITVNDTTMPPREGVKYVCCGGCRQWLLAPRDAVYVACGTCQAINNCNLAQNNRQAVDAETRAITQAPARRFPWFLECFEGVL